MVAIDELYYLATGGGVTFGGGEPLLYSEFIIKILELGAKKWNVTIETSLNVPFEKIKVLLPYINEMIVDVKEINPKTMESKLIKNLYFAGEVVDVDAYTGGYNLQAAFSMGAAAGNWSVWNDEEE
jgi:organic radical activating enzyme